MSIFNIEPTGFQALEHRFNGPSFLIGRKGFLGFAEGHEDLRFGLPGLILDHGSGQVAELATDTIDVVQNPFLPMFEVVEDVLSTYLLTGSRVFHPKVVTDADMVLDSVVVKPLEPFVFDELPVCYQAFDAIPTKQADESLHNVYPFFVIGVPAFGQQPKQDGERHMIVSYAQHQRIDIELCQLPVSAVHGECIWTVERDA